uniref:Next to BRCA1 gene 1 protein n=1 Tax=Cacopsylla melanoneura TaxID=428564 RepID=A0A8D8XSR9_9HEMI
MESVAPQSGDLHFKIKFNDDSYSDQPFKVVDRGDLTYQEFIGILENVYGLQPGSITGMTYVDQDFDEVAVGSNEEFKQLLKSAHRWRLDNQYCLLNITTLADFSEDFENIGSVTGSDITDLGSVQMDVLNKVNDMDQKLKPLLSAQSEPPAWFQQYMAQFKGEILQEVQGLIQKQPTEKLTRSKPKHHHHQTDVVHEKKNEKNDTHKKIEKFTRKERKIQQKMSRKNDLSKLLKLNIRLRNINTEKNQLISSLSEEEKQQWKVSVQGSSKMHRMDVKEIQDNDRMCITVKPGVFFEYTWTVINCGQSPWTEDTKLSLMSCSQGFEPPKTIVQCPFLEPGDIGQISIQFLAPRFSGTYSSIWKFVHNGHQFGHGLSCMIVVDSACLPEAVESPRSVKTKAQEDISSEDDESSCDDHSDDFVVIPSSFQDKVPRSNCSDGSIEILNPTPTGNSTPSKVWEFSQNGPGLYRTEEGDLISLETPVRGESTPTNSESAPISMASLQKDAVIVVDEIGHCIISTAKYPNPPPSAPNPSTSSTSSSSSSSSSSTFTTSFPNHLSFAAELRTQMTSSQQPETQSHSWASSSFGEQAARFAAEQAAKVEAEYMTRSGSDQTDATAADQTATLAAVQAFLESAAQRTAPPAAEQMAKSAAQQAATQYLAEHAARVTAQQAAQNAAEQAARAARSASEQAARAASVASAVRNIAADVAACESDASGNLSASIQNLNLNTSIPELVNTCAAHAASAAQNVVTNLLAHNNATAAANIPQLVNSCVPHATAAAQTVVTNILGHNATAANIPEVVNTCASHAASAAQNVVTNLLAHNAALNTHRTTAAGVNEVNRNDANSTATNNGANYSSTSNDGISNDSNRRGNGEINVNDIINLCTAQAASTAQNIISGLLNNRDNGGTHNLLNTAASAAQNVMGGFMSMSNTSSTSEANTQTSMHANAQTNTQSHAQTNTQNNTGTNTQSNAQTNTGWTSAQSTNAGGGPEEFVFSAAAQNNMPNMLTQSVTEILSTILAGARTQQSNNQQNSDPAQFGVYSNYPQSRSSSQSGAGNVFVQHPQARPSNMFTSSTNNDANSRIYPTLFTNPVPPSSNDPRLFTNPSATNGQAEGTTTNRMSHRTLYPNWRPKVHKMRGAHSANQGQGQRGADQVNLISSALISSDNSDSGHLSNNSKAKKKAVRKSIKLDRNHARNKIHHRKKDNHSGCGVETSPRLDPTVWIDLTKRLEDLAVTPSDTTRATTGVPEPSSVPQNLLKTSRRGASGTASVGNIWSLRPDAKNMASSAATAPAPVPKPSPTRLSAETFLNPIAFSNLPPVPTHTSPILTPTNNSTTGLEPSTSAAAATSNGANSTRSVPASTESSGPTATRVSNTTASESSGGPTATRV